VDSFVPIVVALIGSGALWSLIASRAAVDRDSRRHEALAADLELYTRLSTTPPEEAPASRETHALAAVVRARLRQRLVRAIMPSQAPLHVFVGLLALGVILLSLLSASQGQAGWYYWYFALLLVALLVIATTATEAWVSKSIIQFLDGGLLRRWPWWVRAFAGPDVRVAYTYLATVHAIAEGPAAPLPLNDPVEAQSNSETAPSSVP
jgi:hypothetical protein